MLKKRKGNLRMNLTKHVKAVKNHPFFHNFIIFDEIMTNAQQHNFFPTRIPKKAIARMFTDHFPTNSHFGNAFFFVTTDTFYMNVGIRERGKKIF